MLVRQPVSTHATWPCLRRSLFQPLNHSSSQPLSLYVCSARFNQFYGHCIALGGICQAWAALVRLNLRPCSPGVKWNCTRFVLATIHLLYYTLNESEGGEPRLTH